MHCGAFVWPCLALLELRGCGQSSSSPSPKADCQQQYVITLLLLDNGTLVPVARPPAPPSYTLSTKVIAGLFLFLIFFVTFAGNVILISTIGSSLTLKRVPHNIVLLQLGICGLFEVVLNVSMITAYLLTQPWRLGRYVLLL